LTGAFGTGCHLCPPFFFSIEWIGARRLGFEEGEGIMMRVSRYQRQSRLALDKEASAQPYWAPLCLPAGVPSGPQNVISIVNETSIILEWHPPRETGGRDDVTYNIICKKCRADRRSCSRCDDNVEFVPRQLGLTECRVSISSLWAHTPYTFDIQAINGVSSKSPFPPQHVSVNITTNQAGKSGVFCVPSLCGWLFVHLCRDTAAFISTLAVCSWTTSQE
jgi:hypothetical protein